MSDDIVKIEDSVIEISINKSYPLVKNSIDLYDYTRGIWKVNLETAKNAKYAFAVVSGEIKEVFEIESWHPAGSTAYASKTEFFGDDNSRRKEFIGKVANDDVREKYVGKLIEGRSWGQPLRYFNC